MTPCQSLVTCSLVGWVNFNHDKTRFSAFLLCYVSSNGIFYASLFFATLQCVVHWKNRGGWKQNRGYSSAVIHPVLANFLQRPWQMFHGTKTQFLFLRNLDGLATKVWDIVCHLNILDFASTTTKRATLGLGAPTLWHIDTWHT